MSLLTAEPVGFIATRNAEAARAFYETTLGLRLRHDDGFALVFSVGTAELMLRIVRAGDFTPQPFTVFGWAVEDLASSVDELARKGVAFSRFGGLPQDDRGIWTSPSGSRIAWFSDPDGNVLSLSQHTR